MLFRLIAILGLLVLVGCATSRTVTISTVPPDATLRIDDRERGRGPLTETFTFPGDTQAHRVVARREGYKDQAQTITRSTGESMVIELKPQARRVTFSLRPMPAIVRLDGKPLSATPEREVAADVEFRIDAAGKWGTRKVTVEREGFKPFEQTLNYEDRESLYVIDLQAMRKDLQVTTTPAGAEVYLNDKLLGTTPLEKKDIPFPVDPETDDYAPQKLRIEKPGYQTVAADISWEDGKINYPFALEPQKKTVRIVTDPPGATVSIGGVEVKPDSNGVHAVELRFGPVNDKGELPLYTGTVKKAKTADSEWEDATFTVAWDGGVADYPPIKLKEILVRKVPLLRVKIAGGNGGWAVSPERLTTQALKDVTDGPERNAAVQITHQPKGAMIDTLAVSPDGSRILFTTLTEVSGELRSQIVTQGSDGSSDVAVLSDGRSLEITPAYTPDGLQIVFASNRAGRKLSIWSMSAVDRPVPEQLTTPVDSNDLWPSVDSNPQPQMYYESRIDTRTDPRLFSKPFNGNNLKDLTAAGGTQPRVAPTADAVLFAAADEKTGKRDIFRMSDQGRDVTNLTNTPDVDEFDAVWSGDGTRVAYVSDHGKSKDNPDNCDVWVLDAAGVTPPVQITTNGGWDDSPAWDDRGRAVYFRSNRGGEWNVWRIELK